MNENTLSKLVIGAALDVHRELGGPGLLERAYEESLCCELAWQNLEFRRQVAFPLHYKGKLLKTRFVLDLLVHEKLIVEVKATEVNHPIFEAQLLTYLRVTGTRLGLVINFGTALLKDGIRRVVNGLA